MSSPNSMSKFILSGTSGTESSRLVSDSSSTIDANKEPSCLLVKSETLPTIGLSESSKSDRKIEALTSTSSGKSSILNRTLLFAKLVTSTKILFIAGESLLKSSRTKSTVVPTSSSSNKLRDTLGEIPVM